MTVVLTNTGKSPKLKNYYAHWESRSVAKIKAVEMNKPADTSPEAIRVKNCMKLSHLISRHRLLFHELGSEGVSAQANE